MQFVHKIHCSDQQGSPCSVLRFQTMIHYASHLVQLIWSFEKPRFSHHNLLLSMITTWAAFLKKHRELNGS